MRALAMILLASVLIAHFTACNRDDASEMPKFVSQCVFGFSRAAGYGIDYLIPENGIDSGWGELRTPEVIEEACESDGGFYCDSDEWISTQAAICIAKNDGEVEDTKWIAFVSYHPNTGLPVWIVETENEASFWEIHAWSGALLSDGFEIVDDF